MKLSNTVKLLITVGALSIGFLGLSIGSAFYTVDRSEKSIDKIGQITADGDLSLTSSQKRLDKAIDNYEKLDRNIHLDKKVSNVETLTEKKKEFVNVSIKLAEAADLQKVKLGLSNEEVGKYIVSVDEYKKEYITDADFNELSNYSLYETLKEKYKDYLTDNQQTGNTGNSGSSDEEIELC